MNKNLKRLSNQPAQMLTAAAGRRNENLNLLAGVVVCHVEIEEPPIASLAAMPRDLNKLWREYTHGLIGRKAACSFFIMTRGMSNINIIDRKSFGKLLTNWLNLDIQQKQLWTAYIQYMDRAQVSQTSLVESKETRRLGHYVPTFERVG
jgi:hypothetical protein